MLYLLKSKIIQLKDDAKNIIFYLYNNINNIILFIYFIMVQYIKILIKNKIDYIFDIIFLCFSANFCIKTKKV